MKYIFLTATEIGRVHCAICGELLEECYCLEPETDEEYTILEQKFGDVANWIVGECCFGAYCGAVQGLTPTLFFEEVIKKLKN